MLNFTVNGSIKTENASSVLKIGFQLVPPDENVCVSTLGICIMTHNKHLGLLSANGQAPLCEHLIHGSDGCVQLGNVITSQRNVIRI